MLKDFFIYNHIQILFDIELLNENLFSSILLDNKPKPETIEIFSVKIRENGTFKMIKMSLDDIWRNGWELRINNFADKEKAPHNEKDIRNQVINKYY